MLRSILVARGAWGSSFAINNSKRGVNKMGHLSSAFANQGYATSHSRRGVPEKVAGMFVQGGCATSLKLDGSIIPESI